LARSSILVLVIGLVYYCV